MKTRTETLESNTNVLLLALFVIAGILIALVAAASAGGASRMLKRPAKIFTLPLQITKGAVELPYRIAKPVVKTAIKLPVKTTEAVVKLPVRATRTALRLPAHATRTVYAMVPRTGNHPPQAGFGRTLSMLETSASTQSPQAKPQITPTAGLALTAADYLPACPASVSAVAKQDKLFTPVSCRVE